MKKKILVVCGGLLIVAVLATVICFIILGDKNEANNDNALDITGTWCVYQYGEKMIDNEQMVFDGETVKDYRDGNADEYMSSSYIFEDSTLKCPDVDLEFTVRIISENNIVLIEPNTMEWKLVRAANINEQIKQVTEKDLVGEYILLSVAGEKKENETMIFDESSFTDYRNGEQFLVCDYELTSANRLVAADINKDYHVYIYNNFLLLVDISEGHVWELLKNRK